MPRLATREKLGLSALLLVGAIPLGVAGYLSYLDADPDIQLPACPSAPLPNGFDLYVEAANLSAQPNPPVDQTNDRHARDLSAARGAIRYSRARREAWHADAAPAWQMFRRAQRTPSLDPYAYGAQRMPGYAPLLRLAGDKNAETRLFTLRGEQGDAVNSALDCVEMGHAIARGGALSSILTALRIVNTGVTPLSESGPGQKQPPERLSAAQARQAAARLAALIARRPSYAEAMERERFDTLARLQRGFERGEWRARNAYGNDRITRFIGNVPVEEPWQRKWERLLTSKRAVVAHINAGFDDVIAELKAPYRPVPRVPDPNMPGWTHTVPRPALDPISAPFVPEPSWRFIDAREKTRLDLLLLRFALQAYRMERGAYPPNLAALQNGYLQQIPTDDFNGGKPYFYAPKNGDYRLWSVGPDSVNDGGKAIGLPPQLAGLPAPKPTPWSRHLPFVTDDSKGDIVARETS